MLISTNEDGSPVLRSIDSISLHPPPSRIQCVIRDLLKSTGILFDSKLLWLLIFGPIALIGDATGYLGEAVCFACSGIALIPCAERLSFVTEQVAAHTNGTIGALLNATFGNAPELLISTAALRAGFYRVLQLAMLGSMLTNLLFVFGIASLIGGVRWQVQELRITSGNVSVGMLLAATAGSLLPAALFYSGQLRSDEDTTDSTTASKMASDSSYVPSQGMLQFSRVNAVVMMILYLAYLIFQLGTHKDEFDEEDNVVEANGHLLLLAPQFVASHSSSRNHHKVKRNEFCLSLWSTLLRRETPRMTEPAYEKLSYDQSSLSSDDEEGGLLDPEKGPTSPTARRWVSDVQQLSPQPRLRGDSHSLPPRTSPALHNRKNIADGSSKPYLSDSAYAPSDEGGNKGHKRKNSESDVPDDDFDLNDGQMSLWTGILWLFIITLCISAMSDILVDTIDGFAYRMQISEVFTSMVIVPFFSNIAEQVSAVIFAYHNKMDLCVGVTVGSAIQIALFVLPGCVLIGLAVDRSMTLFFRGFETCCLFLGVVVVAAVLQGGTTNWLVGITLVGIYIMIATGIWFHELEHLSTDAELAIQNLTHVRL